MSDRREDLFDDEGAGYLVSVSDIMAGLLFVFIITLVAFIIQFNEAKQTQREQIEELQNNQDMRAELLKRIEQQLEEAGIQISVDPESGVLRLDKEVVPFARGEEDPLPLGRRNLQLIAEVLARVIPCFTHRPPDRPSCKPEQKDELSAIFIEGHTDSQPYPTSRDYTNWNLSSERAIESYFILEDREPSLGKLVNSQGQPLFSVSGYAARRPRTDIPGLATTDPLQRRIELRFIMTPPDTENKIDAIRELERQGVS
ncbi:hypothetical protein RM531_15930 [Salinisphaera sp. P385]|uniref:Flagellar motor protein MotB n=1 Tax=Spectribacter acetivorans TaxID=3075603 RepID=A0ABU3BBV7_9GAMM|nr:hypothetical protein [Salinisphaera sp. P385]MDT0619958.1 hypothetical protein [Salinisphaera sp. P385]